MAKYQKDPSFERAIDALNTGDDIAIPEGDSYPPIIIVSPPRSGSTFLNQLLSVKLNLGYTSNLLAAFHQKPALGAALQRKMLGNRIASLQCFSSDFGTTKLVEEPHEFGYFWSRHLSFSDTYHEPASSSELAEIDWCNLKKELDSMSRVFQVPMVLKCSIAVFLLPALLQNLNALVLWIDRAKEDNCRSILTAREERLGSVNNWWSIRPRGFESTLQYSPEKQVDWQFERMYSALASAHAEQPDAVMKIEFDALVSNPDTILSAITARYKELFRFSIEARKAND
ncbi:sulfotransferase [Alteromonas flava]|uniref:sulfotransferase n=1 Tax=Alteromonas flava TaxID=2048003 RepID=UPI0013D98E3C|nr:sulfotransferase [Alteromonas flava]